MTTFPREAQPVLDIIRRETKRPSELPRDTLGGLRFHGNACPMGLCPGATIPSPATQKGFGYRGISRQAVYEFHHWWDYVLPKDAAKAVDFIWGKDGDA